MDYRDNIRHQFVRRVQRRIKRARAALLREIGVLNEPGRYSPGRRRLAEFRVIKWGDYIKHYERLLK